MKGPIDVYHQDLVYFLFQRIGKIHGHCMGIAHIVHYDTIQRLA